MEILILGLLIIYGGAFLTIGIGMFLLVISAILTHFKPEQDNIQLN